MAPSLLVECLDKVCMGESLVFVNGEHLSVTCLCAHATSIITGTFFLTKVASFFLTTDLHADTSKIGGYICIIM